MVQDDADGDDYPRGYEPVPVPTLLLVLVPAGFAAVILGFDANIARWLLACIAGFTGWASLMPVAAVVVCASMILMSIVVAVFAHVGGTQIPQVRAFIKVMLQERRKLLVINKFKD